jgi:hypothetical protein
VSNPRPSPDPQALEGFESRARNRRRSVRRALETPVELVVEAGELAGTTRDLSQNGLLLFADRRLAVEVRFELGGVVRQRRGRLARAQRFPGDAVAYSVEFDEPLPAAWLGPDESGSAGRSR